MWCCRRESWRAAQRPRRSSGRCSWWRRVGTGTGASPPASGCPRSPCEGWRVRTHAEGLRAVGTRAAARYDVTFVSIVPRHDPLADAVEAVGRAAGAVRICRGRRCRGALVDSWELIAALCREDLRCPRDRSG